MKNSSPKKLSADSQPTVGRQSANCWPIVGQLSADCRLPLLRKSSASSRPTVGQVSVENPCRIPEMPQLAGKNIAYRREMKLSHLSPPYCFGFFRDQSPRNLLCLGFLGNKPLTIPSHHPRSQEAVVVVVFTAKSEHYQLIFIIGY